MSPDYFPPLVDKAAILSWISDVSVTEKHIAIQNKVKTEHAGTWLFHDEAFQEWLKSETSSLIYLEGESKSTSASLNSAVAEMRLIRIEKSLCR